MTSSPRNHEGTLRQLRTEWPVLTLYERFEQIVAIVLSLVIAVIVVMSLIQLIRTVATIMVFEGFNPDHAVFQMIFGMIMTLLIAATIAALSGALLALGAVYWLVRELEDPLTEEPTAGSSQVREVK